MKKYRDEICKIGGCPNPDVCLGLCPFLKYIDGKCKAKEVLMSNLLNSDNIDHKNANEVLVELSEDREIRQGTNHTRAMQKLEQIKKLVSEADSLPFYSKRKFAIHALVLLGFLEIDIAGFFNLSRVQIWRLRK